MLPLLLKARAPPAMSSDLTSATTAVTASIDASSELRYTGFVVVVVSRNIDLVEAEAGNSRAPLKVAAAAAASAAWHSGLLANDLEPTE